MTIYETIKAAISVKQAAKHYGLNVNRNGMACCPFHNDRHPSLKLNEDYSFCFGCGAKGDVIDLVARLFDLSSYEAAQKLASDFGLDPKPPTAAAMVKPKRPYIRQFREDEMLCFRVLTDYLHLLADWKARYAPKTPEDALDDRFVEACQMHCHIEYMADILTVGDLEERVALVDKLMQDGKIAFLQEYIEKQKCPRRACCGSPGAFYMRCVLAHTTSEASTRKIFPACPVLVLFSGPVPCYNTTFFAQAV